MLDDTSSTSFVFDGVDFALPASAFTGHIDGFECGAGESRCIVISDNVLLKSRVVPRHGSREVSTIPPVNGAPAVTDIMVNSIKDGVKLSRHSGANADAVDVIPPVSRLFSASSPAGLDRRERA